MGKTNVLKIDCMKELLNWHLYVRARDETWLFEQTREFICGILKVLEHKPTKITDLSLAIPGGCLFHAKSSSIAPKSIPKFQ